MIRHLLLGSGAHFVVSFASLVLLARLFPLDFIADVKAVTVYGGWVAAVLTFQVHSAFLFFHRGDSEAGDAVRAFSLAFLFVAAAVAGLAFFFAFPVVYPPEGIRGTGLAAFAGMVGFNLLFTASPAVYTAHGAGRGVSRLMLLYPTASLAALGVARLAELDVNGYALVQIGLTGAVLAASDWRSHLAFAVRHMGLAARGFTPEFGRYAGRISTAVVLESLGDRVDKLFASRMGAGVFGRYSILCFENPLVGVLLTSYGLGLVRDFRGGVAGREAEFRDTWGRLVRVVTFVTFPVSVFLWLHAQWFINAVLGGRFLEGELVFKTYLLVTLLRYAPFQALMRMEGTVHYNVAMATAFVISATAVSGVVAWSGLSWQFLALGYLAGWTSFNGLAVVLFCRRTGVGAGTVLAVGAWVARMTQCAVAAAASVLAPGGSVLLAGAVFGAVYLVLALSFDGTVRGVALKGLGDLAGRPGRDDIGRSR